MIKLIDRSTVIIPVLACFLFGCGSSNRVGSAGSSPSAQADNLMHRIAQDNISDKTYLQLQAIEQYIATDRLEQAERLLKEEIQPKLDGINQDYKQILVAQLALSKQDINAAQQSLNSIWTPFKLPEHLQIKFFSTRSEAYRRSGNILEAVQERIYLSKHLSSAAEQTANNNAVWQMLSQLTPHTLGSLLNPNIKDELNAWVAFASITKQYDLSPGQMLHALNSWKSNYPNHPAISFMPQQSRDLAKFSDSNFYRQNSPLTKPKKIALILPLHGTHAQSAVAVRDGFLAAFYANKDRDVDKTKIQIYDSTTADSLDTLYQQTVDEGADFIVGPLIKEDVELLNTGSKASVPMLALNVTPNKRSPDNVLQFGLSPEMEARIVADKAWSDGHRNALIVTPESAWGTRMQTSFQEYWQAMGGKVLGVEQVHSQANLNQEIQHLLAIDKSNTRAQQLKNLGLSFSFDPRRRQDPDMIFVATNPALARQLKPLLNFYYAARLPAYASSSIFNGKPQPNLDQDLNGIHFCDMPWVLDDAIKSRATYKSVAELWPREFEQYARLYALGLDAFKIAMQIDQLAMLPQLGISGMTGMLTMDKDNKIQRRLMWASFKKGLPYVDGEKI